MHKHSKPHNKIVRGILKQIAHKNHKLYPEIKKRFVVDGDMEITMNFWDLLKIELPKHPFTEVSCCPDCGKFDLE